MQKILIIIIILKLFLFFGCKTKIPSSKNYNRSLLVISTNINSNSPVSIQTVFEPRFTKIKGKCLLYEKCENMTHTFNLSNGFELISFPQGEYKLKEINFIDHRLGFKFKTISLNEKFEISKGQMIILNNEINYNQKKYNFINPISPTKKESIINDLSKHENFDSWLVKNNIGWSDSKIIKKIPNKNNLTKIKLNEDQKIKKTILIKKDGAIVIPSTILGNVSVIRQQILQNTLTQELSKHFQILPQDQFERVQEKVFEELEYEECTEDQCIIMIQEMLQIENLFHLQIIGEEGDTQLNLKWVNLDEKKNKEDFCEGCKTKELRKRVVVLVNSLVE